MGRPFIEADHVEEEWQQWIDWLGRGSEREAEGSQGIGEGHEEEGIGSPAYDDSDLMLD